MANDQPAPARDSHSNRIADLVRSFDVSSLSTHQKRKEYIFESHLAVGGGINLKTLTEQKVTLFGLAYDLVEPSAKKLRTKTYRPYVWMTEDNRLVTFDGANYSVVQPAEIEQQLLQPELEMLIAALRGGPAKCETSSIQTNATN